MARGYLTRKLAVPATGNGDALALHHFSDKYLSVGGTWGTADLAVQLSYDEAVTWVAHPTHTSLTADSIVSVPEPCTHLRLVLSSGSGHTLSAWVRGLRRDQV